MLEAVVGLVALTTIFSILFSEKFRVPGILLLVLFGAIIGPHGLGFIKEKESIQIFSEIGALLLFFIIGTEFNFKKLKEAGIMEAFSSFLFEFIFTLSIFYFFLKIFGIENIGIAIASIAFVATGTSIVIKMLEEMGLKERKEVKLVLGISIVEDITAIFLVSLFYAYASGSFSFDYFLFQSIKSFLGLALLIIFISKLAPFFINFFPEREEIELMLPIAFLSFFVWLSSIFGISTSLGAFIAGSLFSSFQRKTESIEKFGPFFISFFFLSFGMDVSLGDFPQVFQLFLMITLIAFIAKFIPILLIFSMIGYDEESSIIAASSMIIRGEVTLPIMALAMKTGLISDSFVTASSLSILFLSFLSFFLLKKRKEIKILFDRFKIFKITRIIILPKRITFKLRIQSKYIQEFLLSLLIILLLGYLNLPTHERDVAMFIVDSFLFFIFIISFSKLFSDFLFLIFTIRIFKKRKDIRKEFFFLLLLLTFLLVISLIIEQVTKLPTFLLCVVLVFVLSTYKLFKIKKP
ncbi:MAG: cation:proton antiporter [Candidatus Micrarchaeia archaeon]|jgi:CPA2 family monovalent cation:H+ antiporter-2